MIMDHSISIICRSKDWEIRNIDKVKKVIFRLERLKSSCQFQKQLFAFPSLVTIPTSSTAIALSGRLCAFRKLYWPPLFFLWKREESVSDFILFFLFSLSSLFFSSSLSIFNCWLINVYCQSFSLINWIIF